MIKLLAALLASTAALAVAPANAQVAADSGSILPPAGYAKSGDVAVRLFGGVPGLGFFDGKTWRSVPLAPSTPITAPGATTPATMAGRALKILTVEDFEAKGDGQTDDTGAFSRYAAYLRQQFQSGKGQKAWVLGFGRIYLVSGPVDATNMSYLDFEGNHSTIQYYNQTKGAPSAIFDMLGTNDSHVSNLSIKGCTQQMPCSNGIQVGRYTDGQGYPENTFDNVYVDGYFKQAGFHNNGSELLTAYSPTVLNRYVSGCTVTATNDGSDACSYALIQDGTNHWPMASTFLSVNMTKNLGISFLNNSFYRPILFNLGDGPAVWMASTFQHHYYDGYTQVQGFGSAVIPSVVLAFPTTTASQVPIKSLDWDVHDEFGSSVNFYISANNSTMPSGTAPRISGIEMKDAILQSRTAVFGASPTATFIFLTDLKATIPTGGTQYFLDTPSKYIVSGDVYYDESGYAASFFNLPQAQQFHGRIRGTTSNNNYATNSYGGVSFGNVRYTSAASDPVTSADGSVLVIAQNNAVAEALPACAAATKGFPLEIIRVDGSANSLTVAANGSDKIITAAGAVASTTIGASGSLRLRCAGDGNWYVVGKS